MQLQYAPEREYTGRTSAWADFPVLREVLAPQYAALPTEELEALIERTLGPGASAEDLEGIFDDIGRSFNGAGRSINQFGGQAAPYVAPALTGAMSGAMAGAALGPYGMLGGALLGGTLGVLGAANQPPAPPPGAPPPTARPQPPMAPPQPPMPPSQPPMPPSQPPMPPSQPPMPPSQPPTATPVPFMGGLEVPVGAPAAAPGPGLTAPVGGSPAASILMGLLARPEILQALFAMLMGGLGRGTVSAGAGGAQVPVAAIGQLLGQLGAQASAEFAAVNPAAAQVMPHYLMNSAGEFVVDPAISEQVAGHVLALFSESAPPAWPGTRARVAYIGRAPSVEESLVEIYDTLDRVGLTADVDSEYAFVGDDEADEAWWEVTADE